MRKVFAKKSFGQNFLRDEGVIARIVSEISPKEGENLIEIGPGLGALTEPVADLTDHITVIELDRELAEKLRHHPFIREKLDVVEEDALRADFRRFRTDERKLRIYGNLPYNISTQLLFHLMEFESDISDMTFMLQREVVDRLTGAVSTADYGRLSVMVQYHFHAEKLFDVSPDSFIPAPKVWSSIVRLTPLKEKPSVAKDEKFMGMMVRDAFNLRRKTIRNSLGAFVSGGELEELGYDPRLRAENLTVDDFVRISNFAYDKKADAANPEGRKWLYI